MKPFINNQRGMTLVNVLMAAGIGAIILTGITSMITDIFKAQRTIQSKDAQRELNSSIRKLLSDPLICAASFGGGAPTGTGFTKTQIIDSATPPNIKYQTGMNYLNNLVTITGFEVKNFLADNVSVNPKIGKAELNINLNKVGSTIGSPQIMTTIFLQTTLDASNKINSCYAIGIADSLWQLSPSNMADIYYQGGNVGIGTAAPLSILYIKQDQNSATRQYIQNSTSGTSAFTQLLIQTTAGAGGLTMLNPGYTDPSLGGSNRANRFDLRADSLTAGLDLTASAPTGEMRFFTGGDIAGYERMRITSAGNVGIGTSAPASTLDVRGNLQVSSLSTATYTAVTNQNTAPGGHQWIWLSSSTGAPLGPDAMCFETEAGACLMNLYASGNMSISGALTQNSDIRLKRDVISISNALDSITRLNGVTYYWKDAKRDSNQQIGLVAQDVEKIFPQAVTTDVQGMKSVAYQNLVAPIINALREIRDWVFRIEGRLRDLESDNAELKKRNAALETYICGRDPDAAICYSR